MAEQTKNLGFTKPDINEFYNIEVQNENWDKVDDVIGIPSISAASEEEFDAKLLKIASSLSSPVSKFIHVYSTNDSFLMGGRANALITKSIADSLDGGVNASVELYQTTNFGVLKMFKNILKNVVQPLEYLNPPMVLDVEYRTTERWMGKAVYTQYFKVGTALNGASVRKPAGASIIIRHQSYIGNIPLPLGQKYIERSGYFAYTTSRTDDGFYLLTDVLSDGYGSGAYNWFEHMWYTKD